ncbi:alpha/beta fold hydrolase [Acidobacterium sp. S8]|uniref:alpha/beta fold hydrolase n=1 Tax=Acidobacterium sp. S8 TaxID=1641854 RepID=UPI00131E38DA|nr:alpha/beta fold hydrolase [Acidobacterium sp. S8]
MKKIGLLILAAALATNINAQVYKRASDGHVSAQDDSSQSREKLKAIQPNLTALHYGWQSVDGINLFYREGGPVEAPTLVFLHGSPTSSIMYQSVMEQLAATGLLHVIAMDYPSYGYSDAPNHEEYPYTFDHVAETVAHFLAARNIKRYALYMQDYGAPIGFRLMQAAPDQVSAIIVQNGVIHLDGFPFAQDPNGKLRSYWRNRDLTSDKQFADEAAHTPFPGASNWTLGPDVNPDNELLTTISQQRPGVVDAHLDLWFDSVQTCRAIPSGRHC